MKSPRLVVYNSHSSQLLDSLGHTGFLWNNFLLQIPQNLSDQYCKFPGHRKTASLIGIWLEIQVRSASKLSNTLFWVFSIGYTAAAAAKLLQSCPTLCNATDGSPPGSPIPGILQARTLEWVAISFSKVWKWKVKVKSFSHVQLLATPWTSAYQAPPSMGFSRQEYWSGLPVPPLIGYTISMK